MASLRSAAAFGTSHSSTRTAARPNARVALTSASPKSWPRRESEAAEYKAGLVDTRELARIIHSGHPLDDHFTEYRASLIAKGATEKHANLASYRARRVACVARSTNYRSRPRTRPRGSEGPL